MSNDVSFKRAEYIEVLDRWSTVRDVCAGQHRVVPRPPPPAPSAWFMQPVEPDLTQRMLKELSPSPMRETTD